MAITHAFTSPVTDQGNPEEVGPDEWNANHTIEAGSIDTTELAAGAVTTDKIEDDAVTTAKIAADQVTYAKIQNVTDDRLLGRSAGSSGDAQEITVGQGVDLASGALKLSTPSALAYLATSVEITNNTDTVPSFGAEQFDTDTMHDNATNPSRITVNTSGKYVIMCMAQWESNSTGLRNLQIKKNGSVVMGKTIVAVNGGQTVDQLLWIDNAVATDYYEINVLQSSGGGLDLIGGSSGNSFLAAYFIGV